MLAGDLAHAFEVPRFGQHDADVGERGLDQHACDVAMRGGAFEIVEIVERHHACGERRIHLRTDCARTRDGALAETNDECFVDGAVVAPVVHDHLRFAGDRTGKTQSETICVGGAQGELPLGKPEAPRQLARHPRCVGGWQHHGGATRHLMSDCLRHFGVRMAGHRPRVAQTQVDVFVAVDVGEARALCRVEHDRERPGPAAHPRHRHARHERTGRVGVCARLGVQVDEALRLGRHEFAEARAVDARHQSASLPFVD